MKGKKDDKIITNWERREDKEDNPIIYCLNRRKQQKYFLFFLSLNYPQYKSLCCPEFSIDKDEPIQKQRKSMPSTLTNNKRHFWPEHVQKTLHNRPCHWRNINWLSTLFFLGWPEIYFLLSYKNKTALLWSGCSGIWESGHLQTWQTEAGRGQGKEWSRPPLLSPQYFWFLSGPWNIFCHPLHRPF